MLPVSLYPLGFNFSIVLSQHSTTDVSTGPQGDGRLLCLGERTDAYVVYALDVLAVRGDNIATIVSFIDGSRFGAHGLPPLVRR